MFNKLQSEESQFSTLLEMALRALASSSGAAVCPGGTQGQPRGYPGSTPGVDPRSQGMIPKRFKRKKIFVTETGNRTDGRTDRRDSRNSYVDYMSGSMNLMPFI